MGSEWFIIVASGPSLRRADTEALRHAGKTVAVNCAIFFAPWADYLFAADAVWWKFYTKKIAWFKGRRVTRTFKGHGVDRWQGKNWPRTGGNSGHMAIQYAVDQGARKIALLGFDQMKTNGKAHFHADHPKEAEDGRRTNMANAGGIMAWPRLMHRTSIDLKKRDVEVVNVSRETALKCFPRVTVEKFLEDICQ